MAPSGKNRQSAANAATASIGEKHVAISSSRARRTGPANAASSGAIKEPGTSNLTPANVAGGSSNQGGGNDTKTGQAGGSSGVRPVCYQAHIVTTL